MSADLLELLTAGHRRLESLFADAETASTPQRRRDALADAADALARHADAESRFLHPALREHLPAGPDIASYEEAEHASFAPLTAERFDAVRQHMQEEETELFPRLAQACPAGELRRLGEELANSVRVTE
ncbi:hemerythrin domain-containing protein [Dactylosporangium sp. NPDC049140]|jgi:hemerythrin-like domain-containing protein|uniref:hemerythrin domain-containing protein n=1 Tax=Dactylosporangium sp. NPDC049140 TaxID=3155647 RepID=UPI0033DA3321